MRLILALLLLPSLAAAVELADATTLQIVMELTARGITSWGCGDCPDCPEVEQINTHWTPPSEGSPVEHYVWRVEMEGTAVDTTMVLPMPDGMTRASMMVSGVDALGRQGRWSHPGWWPINPPGVTMEVAK